MDIRHLQALLAVVDHGSFSAAAKALYTVQSNVSAHVARLESDVGHQLLDRRTRQLTPAGEAVASRARLIMSQMASITDDLAALEDRIIGQVRVGATPAVGQWLLPPVLADAGRDLPDVQVIVIEAQSDELVDRLVRNELDLAITTGGSTADLRHDTLFEEAIVAVVPEWHELADREGLDLDDLDGERLLLPLPDNPLHQLIDNAFAAEGRPLNAPMEIGSSALSVSLAAEGVGIALVPASAATGELGAPRSVSGLRPRRVALSMRPDPLPAAAGALRRILIAVARSHAETRPGCRRIDHPAGANL